MKDLQDGRHAERSGDLKSVCPYEHTQTAADAAKECSPGRKPWVVKVELKSPGGAKEK